MGFSTILLEKSESISTLTLNRPEARNAVDVVMREEIVAALDEIEGDAAVRVLIVVRCQACVFALPRSQASTLASAGMSRAAA